MKNLYRSLCAGIILATLSSFSFADNENDPLVEKWKTIDDRTGYSRADVEVSKKPDGTYEGVIVATRNIPLRKIITCTKCPGNLKRQSIYWSAFYLGL